MCFGRVIDGRPFLVEAQCRTAAAVDRSDWHEGGNGHDIAYLARGVRARLSDEWTRVALMEHASIAAFARFTLQLMSLGAPSELVERSNTAMADETRHAKLAFTLASRYADREIGPGPLDVTGALEGMSLRDVVLGTLREGCIGETIAALEAAEALEHATDPAVRAALTQIVDDETRHAELAWRFVRWALAQGDGSLRAEASRVLKSEGARMLQNLPLTLSVPLDPALRAHGVLSDVARAEVRAAAIEQVVLRCGRAIFEEERAPRAPVAWRAAPEA